MVGLIFRKLGLISPPKLGLNFRKIRTEFPKNRTIRSLVSRAREVADRPRKRATARVMARVTAVCEVAERKREAAAREREEAAAAAEREREEAEGWAECFCGELRHRPEHPLPFAGVWLCCDQCDRWCHAECAGIDGATIDDTEDYTCPRCLGGVAEEGSSSGEGEHGAAAGSRGDGRKRRRGAARSDGEVADDAGRRREKRAKATAPGRGEKRGRAAWAGAEGEGARTRSRVTL